MFARSVPTNAEHEALMNDMKGVLRKYMVNPDGSDRVPQGEVFGVLCQLTGQLLALMDQRKGEGYWKDMMIANIMEGNKAAVAQVFAELNKESTKQ